MSQFVIPSAIGFFITLVMIVAMAPIARRIGLVDSPTGRKQHENEIPLVGGLAIFISVLVGVIFWGFSNNEAPIKPEYLHQINVFLGCCGILALTGALDDRFQLGVLIRIASETIVALIIVHALDLRLTWLGNLFGTGNLHLPAFSSYVFTLFCIVGLINAFNMLDGIDGLLASTVVVTLISLNILAPSFFGLITALLLGSLTAFLISNLQLKRGVPKSFLGDSGSKLLGFYVVCLLIPAASAQIGGPKLINPVTALYLVFVPLADMVFTALRRMLRWQSPFTADRSHIHHLLLDLGFSHRRALKIIIAINSLVAGLGILLHRLQAPEHVQMALFLCAFLAYCIVMRQCWLLAEGASRGGVAR